MIRWSLPESCNALIVATSAKAKDDLHSNFEKLERMWDEYEVYEKMRHDVVVIGGGAAGMLSAAVAAERGLSVLLLENDRLGLKLRITGKGRCNVTNDCSVKEAVENIPTGGRFLMSALSGFTPKDTIALLKSSVCR